MATPDELKAQAAQTQLGLLQQSVEYSKKLITQRQAEASQLENEFNSIDRAGPRSAYLTAKADPNADPATVADLKAKYDAVKEQSADISARLDQKNRLLADTQKGLTTNEAQYEQAKALAPAGTTIASPTTGATTNDPVVTKPQTTSDNKDVVPTGNQLNTDKTTINSNTEGLPVQAEDGSLATSKRNPETGELYNPVPPQIVSGLTVRNEDGSVATSRINPETGELYNPVAGSVAQGDLSAVPDPQKTPPSDANNGGEGFGNVYPDGFGGYVNGDGQPTDANGSLIPTSQPQKTIDVNNGGEGFGNVYPDGFGGYVNGDGQPTDANGMLISTSAANNDAIAADDAAAYKTVPPRGNLITDTPDWRVRLSLASNASYLYNDAKDDTHILFPLKATSGVIFPYTPTIQSSYRANYDASDLTHANYKQYFYKNSSVEEITITAEFTAQDNTEAKYLLATIHFFKSVTKMFYGKDTNPAPGTPPPLCFLNGYGTYQYNQHPLLITNFQYTLPNDVDYVRTVGTALGNAQSSGASVSTKAKAGSFLDSLKSSGQAVLDRLKGNKLNKGAVNPGPTFNNLAAPGATYVPSKIQITISAIPIVTRGDISNTFSVKDYASGKLLKGNARNPSGPGIW